MTDTERPIRVVMFGGAYLQPGAVEFALQLEAHPQIDLIMVLCQTGGVGTRHRIANLLRRRGLLALPILLHESLTAAADYVRAPRSARQRKRAAAAVGANVVAVPDVHSPEALARVRAAAPELGVIYGSPVLRPELYEIPRHGTLGIHHGRVPDYRGKKTTFWEMYNGESVAGVAIQRVNRGIDTGDIARTGVVPIGQKSYAKVEREVELLGHELFLTAILDVRHGRASYQTQDSRTFGIRKYRQPTGLDIVRFWLRRRTRARDRDAR